MRSGAELAMRSTLVLPVSTGRIVGGKYELVRRIGAGSMGEVWLAVHQTLGESVAVKLLSSAPRSGEIEGARTAAARFCLEAQIAARLSRRCRHIVCVTDHGEEGGLAYLVMELLDGQTLHGHLMHRGRMPPSRVAAIVGQIARALEHAHSEGVVHRDLKPANTFLTRDEDGSDLVKLLDFGIARLVSGHRMSSVSTAPDVVFGTPGYMSPEQAFPLAAPDHHCDLWALATVAYEMLSEELPVPGVSTYEVLRNLRERRLIPIHERAPDLPQGLAAFFARAFAERVEDRYPSAADLARAFDRALGDASAVRIASRGRPRIRARAPMAAAATVLFAAGVGGAIFILSTRHARPASASEHPAAVPALGSGPARPDEPPATVSDEPLAQTLEPLAPAPPTGATVLESAPRSTGGAGAAPPKVSPAPAPSSTAGTPGCDPPFEIDARGIKRWRSLCL